MPSAVVRIVSIAILLHTIGDVKFPQANNNRVFKTYDVDSWLAFGWHCLI